MTRKPEQLALFDLTAPANPSPWLGPVELPIRFTPAMWAACQAARARDPFMMEWWRIGVLEGRYVREE